MAPTSHSSHHIARVPERSLARRVAMLVALILSMTVLLPPSSPAPAGAIGILPPANPALNITPRPNFTSSGDCSEAGARLQCTNPCVGHSSADLFPAYVDTTSCTAFLLKAIDTARAAEELVPMDLPSNWLTLTPAEQLFVLADLERTARGLPPYLGLNRALSNEAQRSALSLRDPSAAPGFAIPRPTATRSGMGGALAYGGASTLETDYEWMYYDGWGGSAASTPNAACSSPTAPGCWAHRDELLGDAGTFNAGVGLHCATCEMGTGYAIVKGLSAYIDLVELPAKRPPAMYFTWAKNVLPYLPTTTIITSTEPLGTTTTSTPATSTTTTAN